MTLNPESPHHLGEGSPTQSESETSLLTDPMLFIVLSRDVDPDSNKLLDADPDQSYPDPHLWF